MNRINRLNRCIFIIAWIAGGIAPVLAATIPEIPAGHPRLYIQADEVAALKQRVEAEPYRNVWKDIKAKNNPLCHALVYLLEGDARLGRMAIEESLKDLYDKDVFSDTRHFDSAYHQAACVYDWCYPLLSEQQKQRFIDQFTTLPNQPNKHGTIYIGYPARMTSNAATGHQCEGYLLASQIPAGIAIYDENQLLFDAAAKLFFEKFVPIRDFHYASHTHHQGTFYGVGRFHYDVWASWLFRNLGAGDVVSGDQRFVPYYYLYMQQPDGVAFPVGDAIAGGGPEEVYAKVGSYYHDPVLLGLAPDRFRDAFGMLFDLLYRDYETTPESFNSLPLTKYFPSPTGLMVARTGWDISPDSHDAAVMMNIGESFFGNHQHYDSGTFQVSYRGPLAIASGYYDDFGGRHNANYYNSTVSKNGLLLLDPDEKIRFNGKTVANDGGQTPRSDQELEGLHATRMARVSAHQFGPDSIKPTYSYIAGDLSPAYSPAKAESITRSMVTFNLFDETYPAAVIVFDRVNATSASFQKTWLLHCVEEPSVDGNTVTVVRTGKNAGTRATRMPEDARFGGKLVVESLLPAGAEIRKVGGPGKEFWVESAQQNYAPKIKGSKGRAFDPGAWRVELSPSNESREDQFLNVMTVMDADTPSGPPVSLIQGQGIVGASVRDHLVVFGEQLQPSTRVEFEVPPSETMMNVLVCDLKPGQYSATIDNNPSATDLVVTDEGRCLFFRSRSGNVVVTRD